MGDENRAYAQAAKKYNMNVDEYKTAIDVSNPNNLPTTTLKMMAGELTKYNRGTSSSSQNFMKAIGSRRQSGYKYLTFNASGMEMSGMEVGGAGGLQKLPTATIPVEQSLIPQETYGQASTQASQVVQSINSITTNQQNIVQQQMSAAELERKNAETAIYNQLARSRKRRGY